MTIFAQFATAFGIGRAPKAPGTAASLTALIIAIPVLSFTGWIGMMVVAFLAMFFGVWVADGYGLETGIADPKECVIDEFAGQWLACAIGAMAASKGEPALSIFGYVAAFLLFRLFDIAKPWPVNKAEKLRGGLGIMADDVVAGAIAGIIVFLFADAGLM